MLNATRSYAQGTFRLRKVLLEMTTKLILEELGRMV